MSAFPSSSAADDYGVRVRICVLGGCRVLDDTGAELDLGSRKPRSVVAALALTPGRPVSADALADLVWGGEPPRTAQGSLHAYLSGLRRVLEPERPVRGAASVIETTDHGYVLRVPATAVDAHAFAEEVRAAGRVLAPLASQFETGPGPDWPTREAVVAAVDRLDAALATWAGEPYADLPDHPDVQAERSSLEQLRAAGEEARLLALLAVGDHAGVLATTESATARHPLREGLWATHALALARAGRQADALEALRTVRTTLAEELGIDPGPRLRALESAVLRQSPEIERTLSAPASPPEAAPTPPPRADVPSPDAVPVGRDAERAALTAQLDAAAAGALRARPRSWGSPASGRPASSRTWRSRPVGAASPSPSAGARRTTGLHRCGRGVRCSRPSGAPPSRTSPSTAS